jgi:hypothetical protein
LDVVSAGTYAVTVTDYNGCTNSDVIEVAVTIPVNTVIQGVTITGTQCFNATQTITIAGKGGAFVVQSGGSATLIAGRSILFQYGAMVDQGGYMHAYITTDNTYCGGNTPPVVAMPNPVAAVQADSDSALSSNPDVFRTNAVAGRVDYGFKLYPNPSAGLVNIEVKNPDNPELRITIKDMAGRQVYVKTIQHPRFTEQIDLGRFIHGIYLVELTSGSHSGIFKLVLLD